MARQYKLARKMKKITLTAAAKELNVTQPTLSSWESERKNPSIEGLIRMAQFYGVSTDFLLGLDQNRDPRPDWLKAIDPQSLPIFHETPIYSPKYGWAFVDAVEQVLHFASGETIPFTDAGEIFLLPPAFSVPLRPQKMPLNKSELFENMEVWVEPISVDTALREELRGWYRVKKRYIENEVGQRFYLDFYGAKWLAFDAEE